MSRTVKLLSWMLSANILWVLTLVGAGCSAQQAGGGKNLALRPPQSSIRLASVPRLSSSEIDSSREFLITHRPVRMENLFKETAVAMNLKKNMLGDTYVVAKGDSLYKISRAVGVSISELASLNNISDKKAIKPGMVLKLPFGANEA